MKWKMSDFVDISGYLGPHCIVPSLYVDVLKMKVRSQIFSQQRRVTITLIIVLSCFVLCWIPYCVYSNYVTFEVDKSRIPGYANAIVSIVLYCLVLS
jgi:hypothetical protein